MLFTAFFYCQRTSPYAPYGMQNIMYAIRYCLYIYRIGYTTVKKEKKKEWKMTMRFQKPKIWQIFLDSRNRYTVCGIPYK